MHLFYLDSSAEHHYHTFSAIGVPEQNWLEVFNHVKAFRYRLRAQHGIYLAKELHAWKFLSGRGRPSDRFLNKSVRAAIFNEALALVASFAPHGVKMINVALGNEDWAFERMLNRINRCVKADNAMAMIISDEGKEGHFTKLYRKMAVHNPIPSRYGAWASGKNWRNIPLDRILADPTFHPSHQSNFIQLADFCAFALLRMDKPTAPLCHLGIDKSFPLLAPVCVREANPKDPLGVVR